MKSKTLSKTLRRGTRERIGKLAFASSAALNVLLLPLPLFGSISLGVGSSSFTYGRPVPALAVGVETKSWGIDYRSEGVQTTIYAQNAWTVAGYSVVHTEKLGLGEAAVGAGGGGTYINRSYRTSTTSNSQGTTEYVLGPYLAVKYRFGGMYFGVDTVLGVRGENIQDALTLNYQDVSHITFGMSL